MIWLIVGVLLWSGAHLFKRLAPKARRGMRDAAKGMVAGASILAIVLMVIGFRLSDQTGLWYFGPWAVHANNTLMVIAILLLGLGHSKSMFRDKLRHPMLLSVILWAIAHLLVNGTLPALVLFGGLGLWALVEIAMINKAEPKWVRPKPGTTKGTLMHLVISAVVFVVIVGIHLLFGLNPFMR